jgi:heme exporter protein D
VNAVAWIPVTLYLVFLLHPWFRPGQAITSETTDRMILWFAYHMSLLCLVYLAIHTFRRYQDKSGRLRHYVNQNCYGVYIVHVIVVGAFALPLLQVAIPSCLKHVTLTVATFLGSSVAVILFRSLWSHLRLLEDDNETKGRNVATPRSPEIPEPAQQVAGRLP